MNGTKIASCSFQDGELPTTTPFIGIYGFNGSYEVRGFTISRDALRLAPVLDTLVTLHYEGSQIVGTSLSGSRMIELEIGDETWTFEKLRNTICHQLEVDPFCLQLLLPNGT